MSEREWHYGWMKCVQMLGEDMAMLLAGGYLTDAQWRHEWERLGKLTRVMATANQRRQRDIDNRRESRTRPLRPVQHAATPSQKAESGASTSSAAHPASQGSESRPKVSDGADGG